MKRLVLLGIAAIALAGCRMAIVEYGAHVRQSPTLTTWPQNTPYTRYLENRETQTVRVVRDHQAEHQYELENFWQIRRHHLLYSQWLDHSER